ncbi:MAG: hypothetical protein J6A21_02610 [Lentisphaeria bacterium]|nr:hypothetical protein [Lentisphaeria bacterium]
MKKSITLSLLFTFGALLCAAEELPQFRFTSSAPFKAGAAVSSVWKKADVLDSFVTARSYDAAYSQTSVRGLFDEKNLYLSIRGDVDTRFPEERKDKDLFSSNNFEIFFQPKAGGHYIQIAVDDKGRVYTAYGREETKFAGTKVTVKKDKKFWTADLVIPFTDLKMEPPKEDTVVRFCVMRTNFCTWNGKSEVSAYTPVAWNFHLPDLWAKVLMTRKEGKALRVAGPRNGIQVNLVPNAEFDIPFLGKLPKNVERAETMAMSGEWILRATGPIYQFHQFRPMGFKPNTPYTLRIKARNIGNDGNLRIVQLKRHKGKFSEGRYLAMNLSLGPDFHEYFLPFTTAPEEPWSIVLYKVGGKTPGSGVEVASVKLYEGKIAPFEVRKLGRAGNQKAVKGTAPAKTVNFYGKPAAPISVLCIVGHKNALRESLDIFSGTGVKSHTIVTTGKGQAQDIYETDDAPSEIMEALEKNAYDVYFIGSATIQGIGKDLYAKIMDNVKKGAGLYVGAQGPAAAAYKKLLKEAGAGELASSAPEKAAFPAGMYTPTERDKEYPVDHPKAGVLGKGKVFFSCAPKPSFAQPFKVRMTPDEAGKTSFDLDKYADAYLLRLAVLLSGKGKALFDKIDVKEDRILLESSTIPSGTDLIWTIADRYGNKVQEGTIGFVSPSIKIPFALSSSGKHLVTVHAVKDGKTVDYTAKVFVNPGPAFANFRSGESYTSDETARFQFDVEGASSGMTVNWALSDFSGRILEKGSFEAKKENAFAVPLNAFYTNLGRLSLTLEKDGKVLDRLMENIFIRDLDRKRIYNDYIVAAWPGQGTSSFTREIDFQLENIGIRHHMIPLQGAASTLRSGFSSGTGWIGGGDIFCGWIQKTNVRAQQFNTEKARKRISARAEKFYRDYRKYGVVQSAVCDEPNLSRPDGTNELDEHPENVAVYRQRLEKKFGTIENYNKRHKTTHKSFADITPTTVADARKNGNHSEFVQWRAFNVDRWCEAIKLIADAGAKIDPEAKLSLMNSFGQTAFSGNDYWKLLTKAGLNVSNEYTSAVYFGKNPRYNFDVFYRSFRPDMRVWGFIGYFYTRALTEFAPWWFGLNRFGGFTWYSALGWGYNAVDNPTGALTVWGKDLKEVMEGSRLTKGIGKIFTDYP